MANRFEKFLMSCFWLSLTLAAPTAAAPAASSVQKLTGEETIAAQKRVAYIERKNQLLRQAQEVRELEFSPHGVEVYDVVLLNKHPVYVHRRSGYSFTIYYDHEGQPELLNRFVQFNGSSWNTEDILFLGPYYISLKEQIDQESCRQNDGGCHTNTRYAAKEMPPELEESAEIITLANQQK